MPQAAVCSHEWIQHEKQPTTICSIAVWQVAHTTRDASSAVLVLRPRTDLPARRLLGEPSGTFLWLAVNRREPEAGLECVEAWCSVVMMDEGNSAVWHQSREPDNAQVILQTKGAIFPICPVLPSFVPSLEFFSNVFIPHNVRCYSCLF